MPIDRIRDVLYNIEQFKADALKLPEIKSNMALKLPTTGKGGSQTGVLRNNSNSKESVDGPVYGQGAKSSGSLGGTDKTSSGASKILSGGNQG